MAAPNFGSQGRGIAVGFIAGAVSALTFHAFAWWVFYLIGMQRLAPYPMIPNGFGVPLILSLAFWAGIWGIVMVLIAPRIRQPFWVVCVIVSLAASVVQAFALPPLLAARSTGSGRDPAGVHRQRRVGIGVAIIAPLVSNASGGTRRKSARRRFAAGFQLWATKARRGYSMRMFVIAGVVALAGCARARHRVAAPGASHLRCSAEAGWRRRGATRTASGWPRSTRGATASTPAGAAAGRHYGM
jgi:hypothetical protein